MGHFTSFVRAWIVWFWCTAAIGIAACTSSAGPSPEDLVMRGEYLVTITACDDCHSPKVFEGGSPSPDPARRLSGYPADASLPAFPKSALGAEQWAFAGSGDMTAWAGPWGISFAANLTPHKDGLGLWTERQFVETLRKGTHLGVGRQVLPPMPWPAYRHMSDEDLRAIYAYLKTLPPVANVVPQPMSHPLAQSSP